MAKVTKAQLLQQLDKAYEEIEILKDEVKTVNKVKDELKTDYEGVCQRNEELEEEVEQVTADRDFAVKQANQFSALYHARLTDIRVIRETLNKFLIADPNIDKKVL